MSGQETWRLFWAKTLPEENERRSECKTIYPLWAHVLDVANVACLLWEDVLASRTRDMLLHELGLEPDAARHFLGLWIGLHDVGKAIPQFQQQHKPSARKLAEAKLPCYETEQKVRHEHASIAILYKWLTRRNPDYADSLLTSLTEFVGFHHGKLCTRSHWENIAKATKRAWPLSSPAWQKQQQMLVEAIVRAWGMPDLSRIRLNDEYPAWLLAFAGWTTFADWIGSMAEFFNPSIPARLQESSDDFVRVYVKRSRVQARNAIRRRGLDLRAALNVEDGADGFLRIFHNPSKGIERPRELQQELAELPLQKEIPSLTIVEAPTGEGKSEAAFFLAARQQRGQAPGGGLYVAMPTQATSDEQFLRFRDDFLLADKDGENEGAHNAQVGGKLLNLHLVHGNALFHPEIETMRLNMQEFAQLGQELGEPETEAQARAVDWFQPRKRGLLAPYGVGTVDQAFLGVLYARHFFLRLFGLTGKTVIFDEVHAYDTYMSTLFERLLQWLHVLRCHVILLSATLPENTRVKLMQAWGVKDAELPEMRSVYPAIWHVTDTVKDPICFKPSQYQHATLHWYDHQPEAVVRTVIDAVRQKGTVAIICNTVVRAQTIFEALLHCPEVQAGTLLDRDGQHLVLYHARYPQHRRQDKDDQVRNRFGKGRPDTPGVLVATQVAEQSLDLDVDLMLSDLAPIDLLLQRAGRLQRHQQRKRPSTFQDNPRLYVLCPPLQGGLPKVSEVGGGKNKVYDRLTLWKTWWVLNERIERDEGWNLPSDYRPLIEAVYRDLTAVPDGLNDVVAHKNWKEAAEAFEEDKTIAIRKAKEEQLIPPPMNLKKILSRNYPELAEEDEKKAEEHAHALTRLGPPSVEVLCLYRHGNVLRFGKQADAEAIPFDLAAILANPDATPKLKLEDDDLRQLRALVMQAVRLSDRNIVKALRADTECLEAAAWAHVVKKNPVLRRYHLLIFKQRSEGWIWSYPGCPCTVKDSSILGLRIHYPKST